MTIEKRTYTNIIITYIIIIIDTWSLSELCTILESQPTALRKHLMYWVSQGVLYEDLHDTFSVMVEDKGHHHEGNYGNLLWVCFIGRCG